MKTIKQSAVIIMMLFAVSLNAAATSGVPEKYDLDGQLEKVTEISKYNFMGWDKVDNQSFILQTGPSDYYLIVLAGPSQNLLFSETIRIPDTNSMVKPGYNNVIVQGKGFNDTCIIDRIYRLKDAEQVKSIKERLAGETR